MVDPSGPRTARLLVCAGLLTLCGGVGAIGWTYHSSAIDTRPASAETRGSALEVGDLATTAAVFQPKPLSAYAETTKRPLFSETRRQLPKKVVVKKQVVNAPAPAHIPIGQLQLAGVIVNGEERLVLIRSPQAPEGAWHKDGETVGGWKIVEISSDFARMAAGKKSADLTLYVDNGGITLE